MVVLNVDLRVDRSASEPRQGPRGFLVMLEWLMLATRWHSDGTPYPNRKLVRVLADGDPLAFVYVAAALVIVFFGPAIYRAIRGR
jgi:hypothetical protein